MFCYFKRIIATDKHGLKKCFVVLKKKIWDADERRFTGFIKLFKKQKRTGGKGVNLRQSAKICVLLKFTTYNLQFKIEKRRFLYV